MKITIPENAAKIIKVLEDAGHEAYVVGGCVRDSLLGRVPNDWDITTSAEPMKVKALFKRTFDTGIAHGTVSVLMGKEIYEVTTYRIDGEYEDSRHPKEVSFTGSLTEDLKRRDFTINAMAYNPEKGLVDEFGGIDDLENKVIRCVGNATERFSEDALRILRALRFSAQLDYTIEKETKEAIKDLAPTLKNISAERIREELEKLLISNNPDRLRDAYELGVTSVILPEFDRAMEAAQNNINHAYSVGEHTLRVIDGVSKNKVLRLAALFHDIEKPGTKTTDEEGVDHFKGHALLGAQTARNVLRRLKYDRDTEKLVVKLVEHHDWEIKAHSKDIRKWVHDIGEECFPAMFELNNADILAQSEYRRNEKLAHLARLEAAYHKMIEDGDCISLKQLKVTGNDLMNAGIPAGPRIGEILNGLLAEVLEDPAKNDRDYLLSRINIEEKE
ncbi:MAG: CCA tRNA nucleotidyltransferase [Lachnospiraceae bacterium]|nr:CCA tRNA nucleotidyltransferase [Lachnospiraceae bacterium]